MEERKETESKKAFHKSLSELAEYCKKKGVRIAIENILHGSSARDILKLLDDRYDPDVVGLLP